MSMQLLMARARMNHQLAGGDPHWDKVVALLRFDGTTPVDEKGHTWTLRGSASSGEPGGKFSNCAVVQPGGSGIESSGIPQSDFDFMTGAYTAEMWIYRTANQNEPWNRVGQLYWGELSPGTYTEGFGVDNSGDVGVGWYDGNRQYDSGGAVPVNEWAHIAVSNDGIDRRLFVNGVLTKATTVTTAGVLRSGSIFVGGYAQTAANRFDELRLTKGVARYTGNFTPPTAPFPNHA